MLLLEGKPVFIDADAKPLSESKQAVLRQRWAVRQDYLAVDLPFSSAYFPESRKQATETQAAMLQWREDLYDTMRRPRESFVRSDRENVLSLFPLANYWGGFAPSMRARQIIEPLERHAMLLMKELDEADEKQCFLFRLWRDVPGVLREGRSRAGHDRDFAGTPALYGFFLLPPPRCRTTRQVPGRGFCGPLTPPGSGFSIRAG
jgi:hypothetical protein